MDVSNKAIPGFICVTPEATSHSHPAQYLAVSSIVRVSARQWNHAQVVYAVGEQERYLDVDESRDRVMELIAAEAERRTEPIFNIQMGGDIAGQKLDLPEDLVVQEPRRC